MNYRFLIPALISFEKDDLSCYALDALHTQHYLEAKYTTLL